MTAADATRHFIEAMLLIPVTVGMLIYFVTFLLATWAERPQVGRHADGRPRAVRSIRHG